MEWLARLRTARLDGLASKAAAGDRDAFRRLYAALHPAVSAFVRRRVRVREDAEDLVAKTFERLVGSLSAVREAKGGVRAYALGIARNAIVDHRRLTKPTAPIEPLADVLASPIERADESMERDERLARVRAAVAAMSGELQELVAMRFGDELSWREIAALTGENEAALRQRVSRALREMKTALVKETTEGVSGGRRPPEMEREASAKREQARKGIRCAD